MTSCLCHVIGRVDDLSGMQSNDREITLTPQPLTGSHHLTKRDMHLRLGGGGGSLCVCGVCRLLTCVSEPIIGRGMFCDVTVCIT